MEAFDSVHSQSALSLPRSQDKRKFTGWSALGTVYPSTARRERYPRLLYESNAGASVLWKHVKSGQNDMPAVRALPRSFVLAMHSCLATTLCSTH